MITKKITDLIFTYSKDGFNWKRDDNRVHFKLEKSFDNKMICYQFVFEFNKIFFI